MDPVGKVVSPEPPLATKPAGDAAHETEFTESTPAAELVAGSLVAELDFETFYLSHRDEIGRALTYTLGDPSLGEEAVDEAMARAYERWDELASTENPAGWVYVVGRRWGLSWRRSRRRERAREQLVAEAEAIIVDPMRAEYVDLMQALAGLEVHQRTVVVCRYSLGLSTAETAELLSIREGTVKSRLARALERMRPTVEVRP